MVLESKTNEKDLLVSYGEEFALAIGELSQYPQTIDGHGACNVGVYISITRRKEGQGVKN